MTIKTKLFMAGILSLLLGSNAFSAILSNKFTTNSNPESVGWVNSSAAGISGTFTGNGANLTNLPTQAPIFSPLKFGAAANGITDDSSSISNAILAASTANPMSPNIIDFQGKSYMINSTIYITNEFTTLINGTLYVTNQNLQPAIWIAGDFVTLEYINLLGPGTNAYVGTNVGIIMGDLPSGGYIQTPTIRKCRISNFSTNVWGNYPVGFVFDQSWSIQPKWTAIGGKFDEAYVISSLVGFGASTHYGMDWGRGNAVGSETNTTAFDLKGGLGFTVFNCDVNDSYQLFRGQTSSLIWNQNNSEGVWCGVGKSAIELTNCFQAELKNVRINSGGGAIGSNMFSIIELNSSRPGATTIENVLVGGVPVSNLVVSVFGPTDGHATPNVKGGFGSWTLWYHAAYGDAGTYRVSPGLTLSSLNLFEPATIISPTIGRLDIGADGDRTLGTRFFEYASCTYLTSKGNNMAFWGPSLMMATLNNGHFTAANNIAAGGSITAGGQIAGNLYLQLTNRTSLPAAVANYGILCMTNNTLLLVTTAGTNVIKP